MAVVCFGLSLFCALLIQGEVVLLPGAEGQGPSKCLSGGDGVRLVRVGLRFWSDLQL